MGVLFLMEPFMNRSFSYLVAVLLIITLPLQGCSLFGKGSSSGNNESGSLDESTLNADRDARFAEGSLPTAEGEGPFRDIRFDYDSAAISDSARLDIESNAEVLKNQPNLRVQLEGHCDERGTNEYNLALGQERARAVLSVLVSLGIPRSRLETISYGEEVPLDTGHDESAWARNRRVHFSAFTGDR